MSKLLTTEEPSPINTRVVGVEYLTDALHGGPSTLAADAVVLTTGGFGYGGNSLLRKWVPWLVDMPCTNGPFAVGDGIALAEQLHASLIHMNQVARMLPTLTRSAPLPAPSHPPFKSARTCMRVSAVFVVVQW